jgi:histidine triad (HIT) family protein
MADCIFCRIADHEIPSKLLYEDEDIVAFEDAAPQAPVHFLVIPRKHVAAVKDMPASEADLLGRMLRMGASLAKEKGLEPNGYRFVLNYGKDGGQLVDHLHLHVLGGRALAWPPG